MDSTFVWMRQEFPWLRSGFLHAVAAHHLPEFVTSLRGLGFSVLAMEPSDGEGLFGDLGRLFAFPACYGGSGWDAVIDCFSDVTLADRTALVWLEVESFASTDPKIFGEACHVLSEVFESLRNIDKQAELVLVGRSPSFRSP